MTLLRPVVTLISLLVGLVWRHWRGLARMALLYALVTALAPPQPRAVLGTPQRVEAVEEHVCVHTRLIDEVQPWVIQRSLEMVREMGAGTIVEFFPWAYIERQPDQYDWRQTDIIVRHAENQGLRIIARMGFVPEWAQADVENPTLNTLPAESFADFADFVAVFAERYAGIIDHIIIWNEPNLAFEWGYAEVNPAEYVRMLEAVYEPAKAANPDLLILAGALAPTLEPEGSSNGLSDVLYLEQMYAAGAAEYFDALAVHTYGFTHPATAEPAFDVLNFRRAELLYDVMAQYHDADTPVFVTEMGWNDHPRWTLSVRPSQRVAYTISAFEYARDHWPQVEELCVWALRYPVPTLSYPDHFTLLTTDFQRKPIYDALRAYAHGEERSSDLWLDPPTE